MEELFDVLNENGVKTGQVLSRNHVHKNGLWHSVVICAIINAKNEILMQKRSLTKDKYPGCWDLSVAGHIPAGENAVESIIREISEEIGIKVKPQELIYMYTFRKETNISETFKEKQFYNFFILRKNIDIKSIKLQESEVAEVKLVNLNQLKTLIKNNEILERNEIYSELIKYMKNL